MKFNFFPEKGSFIIRRMVWNAAYTINLKCITVWKTCIVRSWIFKIQIKYYTLSGFWKWNEQNSIQKEISSEMPWLVDCFQLTASMNDYANCFIFDMLITMKHFSVLWIKRLKPFSSWSSTFQVIGMFFRLFLFLLKLFLLL